MVIIDLTNLNRNDTLTKQVTEFTNYMNRATLADLIRMRRSVLSILDLAELMKQFNLVNVLNILAYYNESCATKEDFKRRFSVFDNFSEANIDFGNLIEALGFHVTSGLALECALYECDNPIIPDPSDDLSRQVTPQEAFKWGTLQQRRLSIATTFLLEANQQLFFHLDPNRLEYLDSDDKWPIEEWSVICKAFPKASDHIKLARRSYLFELPTASVFHMCCALEMGVRWIPGKIKAITAPPDGQQTWGKWRNAFQVYTSSNPRPPLWREIDRISEKLALVEKGVRNQVFHPKVELDDKDARLVFEASHSILEEIAALKGRRIKV